MKRDHPSFFRCRDGAGADVGFLPGDALSSPSASAGIVAGLRSEGGVFSRNGIRRSNRPARASSAGTRRNGAHTGDTELRPEAEAASNLANSSEAVIQLGVGWASDRSDALFHGPKLPLRAFLISFQFILRINKKVHLPTSETDLMREQLKRWVKNGDYSVSRSAFMSKGGSI